MHFFLFILNSFSFYAPKTTSTLNKTNVRNDVSRSKFGFLFFFPLQNELKLIVFSFWSNWYQHAIIIRSIQILSKPSRHQKNWRSRSCDLKIIVINNSLNDGNSNWYQSLCDTLRQTSRSKMQTKEWNECRYGSACSIAASQCHKQINNEWLKWF